MTKRYIRAWLSEDQKTVCWQYSVYRTYAANSVRHWVFGNIVIFQQWQDSPIGDYHAHVLMDAERTGNTVVHRVNLDFWKGDSWNKKAKHNRSRLR